MDLDTSWCPVCDRQIMPERITIYPTTPASPPTPPPTTAKPKPRPGAGGLVHGTGRAAAVRAQAAAIKKAQSAQKVVVTPDPAPKPRTIISQEPTPLYCSEECRDKDERTSRNSEFRSTSLVFPSSFPHAAESTKVVNPHLSSFPFVSHSKRLSSPTSPQFVSGSESDTSASAGRRPGSGLDRRLSSTSSSSDSSLFDSGAGAKLSTSTSHDQQPFYPSSPLTRNTSSTSVSSTTSSSGNHPLKFVRPVSAAAACRRSLHMTPAIPHTSQRSWPSTKGLIVPDEYRAKEEEHERVVEMRNIERLARECDALNIGESSSRDATIRGNRKSTRPNLILYPNYFSTSPPSANEGSLSSLPTVTLKSEKEKRKKRLSDFKHAKAPPRGLVDGLHTTDDEPWTWAAADPATVTYPILQLKNKDSDSSSGSTEVADSLTNKRLFYFTVKKPTPVLTDRERRGW